MLGEDPPEGACVGRADGFALYITLVQPRSRGA